MVVSESIEDTLAYDDVPNPIHWQVLVLRRMTLADQCTQPPVAMWQSRNWHMTHVQTATTDPENPPSEPRIHILANRALSSIESSCILALLALDSLAVTVYSPQGNPRFLHFTEGASMPGLVLTPTPVSSADAKTVKTSPSVMANAMHKKPVNIQRAGNMNGHPDKRERTNGAE